MSRQRTGIVRLMHSSRWQTAALVSIAGLLVAFFAPDAVSDSRIDEVAQRIAALLLMGWQFWGYIHGTAIEDAARHSNKSNE